MKRLNLLIRPKKHPVINPEREGLMYVASLIVFVASLAVFIGLIPLLRSNTVILASGCVAIFSYSAATAAKYRLLIAEFYTEKNVEPNDGT